MILIALLYLTCAATFTLAKTTLWYTEPIFYVAVRLLGAGTLLYVSSLLFSRQCIRRKDAFLFLQMIVFSAYCAYVFDLWSLQFITSSESALIFSLSPFMAALFSYLVFREKMTKRKWLGLLLGFSSFLIMILSKNYVVITLNDIVPLLVLLCSVASSAYGWIVMRELVKNRGYSPFFVNGVAMFYGGIAALATSYWTESWSPSPVQSWIIFVPLTILMILLAHIVFSNLYGYLLKKYTATLLSFAGFLCPFFAMILGRVFLGERAFTWQNGVALGAVIVGLILFYQEELRQGYIQR